MEDYCLELLRRLDRPLSFIGASRANFALIDDEWSDLDTRMNAVRDHPERRDRLKAKLRERLEHIRERLSSCVVSREEALALFEEGTAVKRALNILDQPQRPSDPDVHADTKRWLRYGRMVS
jgi:hypothetical protein